MEFTHRTDEYDYVEYPVTDRAMSPLLQTRPTRAGIERAVAARQRRFHQLKDGRVACA